MSEFIFGVGSNLLSSSKPVQEWIHKTELYFGFNILGKKELIETFKQKKELYEINEPIKFEFKLKKEAFVYLLNISKQHVVLIFPNQEDRKNQFKAHIFHPMPSRNFEIKATSSSTEKFYLIASETALALEEFNHLSLSKAKEKLEHLKTSHLVDVYRVDVEVQ